MAETILFNYVDKILGKLTSLAVQEFFLAWGLESDLKSLETTLSSINAVISDAEEQGATNRKITLWLRRLRDVLYDAEDALDDFAYHVLRKQVSDTTHGVVNSKVQRFFSSSNPIAYRLRIGHRIKDIRERLDEISADKAEFNLADGVGGPGVHLRGREMTSSFLNASDVIGRDGDKEIVVKFLMESSWDGNVCVLPIVGIGGLGKTVLAKIVFNDERVVEHFDAKMWVCLSDVAEFDVRQVLVRTAASITGKTSFNNSVFEQLRIVVQNNLRGKRFLLILDDVWDVNHAKWLELKALLACGGEGSKIVVTTRIRSVATCVGTVHAHNLESIPHEKCVSLFKKIAFSCEEAVDHSLIMKFGDEIVKKCKGVPLAVKSLGMFLFSKSNEHEWLSVRDSSIWQIEVSRNEILSTLKLSYDHLPSHLKQCFVYCSIFPENYLFQDFLLISFWTAHGLLQSRTNQDPTYVGRECIKELLSRGFFQNYKERSWCSCFEMHGLVRDLAISLTQEEFSTISANNKELPENVRHVSFEVQSFPANLSDDNAIRSLLAPDGGFEAKFSEACISKFKLLRFLCLANSEFEELPNSIGTLKHLRSLDLRGCKRLKRLPDSICKLHFLETLLLAGSEEMEELPISMRELVSLKWLWITTKQKHLIRTGIEHINSLNFLVLSGCRNLEFFFEGSETTNLASLQTLRISECESLISLCPLNLRALEVLYIRSCGKLEIRDQEDDVSSKSFQLPSLRSLAIQEMPLMEGLPQWIQGCARTLRYLKIKDCANLRELPNWLPNLTSLRTLKIVRCPKLVSLPEGMQKLSALMEVKIVQSGVLSERCKKIGGEDWPKIAHVPNIIVA